jgi:hypothetical protein
MRMKIGYPSHLNPLPPWESEKEKREIVRMRAKVPHSLSLLI